MGSSTDLSPLPGVAEHAFRFMTLGDALFLRNHLIGVLERAEVEDDPENKRELLTFVVAGGSYTGVEVAAEINDFVREAARSYRHVDPKEVKVILLQSRSRILPELHEELAAFSHRLLERRGIEIRLNTLIKGATAHSAILSGESTIPTRTLVAAIGTAPNRLLDSLPFPRDHKGRLVVDETLAVPESQGLWAVGELRRHSRCAQRGNVSSHGPIRGEGGETRGPEHPGRHPRDAGPPLLPQKPGGLCSPGQVLGGCRGAGSQGVGDPRVVAASQLLPVSAPPAGAEDKGAH